MEDAQHHTAIDPLLDAVAQDYQRSDGVDLLARWSDHLDFWDARLAHGLDPYSRVNAERVGTEGAAFTRGHELMRGVNFACQDYLSLAAHPAVSAAAIEAVTRWGVHGAGSVALQGGSLPLMHLEERLVRAGDKLPH